VTTGTIDDIMADPYESQKPRGARIAWTRLGGRVRRWATLGFVLVRGPRRPKLLGFGALACYIAAGLTVNLTLGLVIGGLGLTLLDWRFGGTAGSTQEANSTGGSG